MTKKIMLSLLATLMLLLAFSISSQAEVNIGLSIDKDGINSFHLSIGEYYHVADRELVVVNKRSIPDEEMAVLFYIADQAGISHLKVIDFRLSGMSWMDITLRLGLTAQVFYLPLKSDPGPPYGKAWGHFKKHKKNKKNSWKKVRLTDSDIINFVNLKFISEKYGYAPEEVIKMRARGESFVSINGKIKKAKGQHKKQKVAQATARKKASKKANKGKGKKN